MIFMQAGVVFWLLCGLVSVVHFASVRESYHHPAWFLVAFFLPPIYAIGWIAIDKLKLVEMGG